MSFFPHVGCDKNSSWLGGHRCLFTAFSVDFFKKRLVFSLCGQSKELNFINQTIDFVGFPFKVYRSTGGFCRSGFSTKPLAAQTLGAQTDNMRLCTTLRCKKCPSESEKVLFSLVGPVLAG